MFCSDGMTYGNGGCCGSYGVLDQEEWVKPDPRAATDGKMAYASDRKGIDMGLFDGVGKGDEIVAG